MGKSGGIGAFQQVEERNTAHDPHVVDLIVRTLPTPLLDGLIEHVDQVRREQLLTEAVPGLLRTATASPELAGESEITEPAG